MSDGARLPAFQFYPADWQGNSNLRRCSHEEKGIWIDMMCILHDQAEYGIVRWTLEELANAVGAAPKKVRALIAKDVLKGADSGPVSAFVYTPRSGRKLGNPVTLIEAQDGPLWYSSRMVKDAYVRRRSGGKTRFQRQGEVNDDTLPDDNARQGEASDAPRRAPRRRHGADQSDGASSSSSSAESKTLRVFVERVFDALWKTWPDEARKRHTQAEVRDAIRSQLKAGAQPDAIIAAGKAHVAERVKDDPKLVKGLKPWLTRGLWRNWAPNGNGADEPADWLRRLAHRRETGEWLERWGPPPGQPGYLGPPSPPEIDLFPPEVH